MIPFIPAELSSEDAFWVMYYFLEEHYELSNGTFDVSDILSASQPMEFNAKGHIDGQALGRGTVAPADNGMISFWNEAVERFRKNGPPLITSLKK